jgi:hypothetical protein
MTPKLKVVPPKHPVDPKEVLKVALLIKGEEAKRRLAGKNLDGKPMPPYSARYADWKRKYGSGGRGANPNLHLRGHLAGSISVQKTKDGVRLAPSGRETPKAMAHQFPLGGKRPKRDVLGLTKEYIDKIVLPRLGKDYAKQMNKHLKIQGRIDLDLGG